MKNKKFIFFILFFSFSFCGNEGGSSWLDSWLTVETGLLLWTITTFLVLLFVSTVIIWFKYLSKFTLKSHVNSLGFKTKVSKKNFKVWIY